ncbi:MAG: hypothetical protein ACI9K2_006996 [Myxococcota bacterium]|jgi:hypothetical protein
MTASTARDMAIGLATMAAAGVGFGLTLAPELGLGDTAILIDQILEGSLSSHVNSHNFTLVTGWLLSHLPIGNTAVRAHLVSWLYGTLGVGLSWLVLRQWRVSAPVASGAALVLAASHSYWWHSTLIESYSANAVFLLSMLLCLERHRATERLGWLGAGAVLAGLALFNHVQMGTLGLACGVWALLPWTPGTRLTKLGTVAVGSAVGASPWLGLLARDMVRRPDSAEVLRWAAGGDFQGIMFTAVGSPWRTFAELVVQQFPSPFLLLIPVGLVAIWRDRLLWPAAAAMGTVWTVNTAFFLFYRTWDQFAFYLPTWVVFALVGGLGAQWLAARAPLPTLAALAVSVLVPVLTYPQIPGWADANPEGYWATRFPARFTGNTHDVRAYLTNPDKSAWTDVRDASDALFAALPQRAIYLDDDSRLYYPIHFYQKHEGARPDLRVVLLNSWGFDNWGASTDRTHGMVRSSRHRVFVVTDLDPFRSALAPLFAEGWHLAPFDLGDDRWVYEMLRPEAPWTPAPIGEVKVRARGKRTSIKRGGSGLATVEFAAGRTPRWLEWTWLQPDGAEAPGPHARLVPSSQERSVVALPVPADGPSGTWTAVLRIDGEEQGRWTVDAE